MNHLEVLDFAKLSEEEMKFLQEAEDTLNQDRDEKKVFLMALME